MSTKERSAILTFYLRIKLILELFLAFVCFGGHTLFEPYSLFYMGDIPPSITITVGIISLINAVFVIFLLKWHKWAFWGLVVNFIILIFVATFSNGIIIGSGGSIVFLLILLKSKYSSVSTWDNLVPLRRSIGNNGLYISKYSRSKIYDQIFKLGELLAQNVLTEDEYKAEKRKLLGKQFNESLNQETKIECLKKLGDLLNKKLINQEEFDIQKQYFIRNINENRFHIFFHYPH